MPVAERLAHYSWGALYTLDRMGRGTLVLDPFYGAPTGHVTIPREYAVRRSSCNTVVVDDVTSDSRYLADRRALDLRRSRFRSSLGQKLGSSRPDRSYV